MLEEQKAEIRARADAATPGPWWTDAKYSEEEAGVSVIAARTDCGALPGNPTRGQVAWATQLLPEYAQQCEADADFIARARTDIPSLLAHIAEQDAALAAAEKRAEEAEAQLKLVRRQRDDMNAAYQFECKAARESEAETLSRKSHAKIIHEFYKREIGRLMQQAEHWAENGKPHAVHHRIRKADAYFQVVVLFDPARRDLGFDEPFLQMERAIASAPVKPDGTYPPSAELARYASPDFFVSEATSQLEAERDTLRAEVERLREGLDAKAAIFEAYATMHRDKGTREGFAKAKANERHAADCRSLTKKEAGDGQG